MGHGACRWMEVVTGQPRGEADNLSFGINKRSYNIEAPKLNANSITKLSKIFGKVSLENWYLFTKISINLLFINIEQRAFFLERPNGHLGDHPSLTLLIIILVFILNYRIISSYVFLVVHPHCLNVSAVTLCLSVHLASI